MSNRPELVNTKKTGGSDLDHTRAVNSNGKVIMTVCLYACASTCVRLRERACLPVCLSDIHALVCHKPSFFFA